LGIFVFEMRYDMAKVVFNEERCKGCKLCTTVCPKKIVVMMNDRLNLKGFHPAGVADIEKCTACTFCATICPDCVIEVYK
jgi:2-oxoglutarate ferredoxin oxidoreductase subunit delta